MRATTEQVAEALSFSICELLAKRLKDVSASTFQQVLAVNEDMATIDKWLEKSCGLLESAAWRDAQEGWRSNLDRFKAASEARGRTWDEGMVERTEESIRQSVARDHAPLRDRSNLFIMGSQGEYRPLADAWAEVLHDAAMKPVAVRSAWVESYLNILVRNGVRVRVER